jgi:GWxTD domain-containing protein
MKSLILLIALLGASENGLKDWAEGPEGIILSQPERNTWRQLRTDAERETFIASFWALRDPSPGTAVNEFRRNFEKRVAEADQLFTDENAREGWRTERGRFYILLGPPGSRAQFKGHGQLRSMELWMYTGMREYPQLPPFFNLLFYQRDEVGSFRQYSPFIDQPKSLVRGNIQENGDAWRALNSVDPALAHASLSLIPSEPVDTSGFYASMASDAILAQIKQIPKTEFERIGKLRELIGVTLKYQDAPAEIDLFPVLTGANAFTVDFQVPRPSAIQNVRMQTILWRGDEEVWRTVADFDAGALLAGRMILAPGSYHIETTLSDPAGTGTFVASRSFDLAPPPEDFSISELLFFREATPVGGDVQVPFAYAGYRFTPRSQKQLRPSEKLDVLFQLIRSKSMRGENGGKVSIEYTIANINNGTERWKYTEDVDAGRFDSNGSLLNSRSLSTSELHPGRYFLVVTATDPAGVRTSQTQAFEMTSFETGSSSRQ